MIFDDKNLTVTDMKHEGGGTDRQTDRHRNISHIQSLMALCVTKE